MRLFKAYFTNLFGIIFIICLFISCGDSQDNSGVILPETQVVNMVYDEYDEYIGRGRAFHSHLLAGDIKPGEDGWLGNPHPIGWCDICQEEHSREECINEFREDFYKKIEDDDFKAALLKLKGKRLGCYCKPEDCHGDVIKGWLDSRIEHQ